MRRHARALVVTITAGLILAAAPTASAHHVPGPCDFHRGAATVRQHSRNQIRCATKQWNVPGGPRTALCIARRESGLLPWAESADGLNKGLFQQHVRWWASSYDTYTRRVWSLPRSILNGRTNAIVSIRMVHDIGWGPWGGSRCA